MQNPTPATPVAGMRAGSTQGVLAHYQLIAGLSARMLSEAKASQWDAVAELGQEYQQAVEHLKTLKPLSGEDREARRQLLIQILDNDAGIRHLVAPELERLNSILGNLKRQQNVLQTYSSPIFSQ
jgi:flagellar protein FliT